MPNYSLRTQGHNIMRMHGSKLFYSEQDMLTGLCCVQL
jgi:hypothetical protein